MVDETEDIKWLLNRIQKLEERSKCNPSWRTTHRHIWQGSYDCWSNKPGESEFEQTQIPIYRMKKAEESGFIQSEIRKYGKYDETIWFLTDLGKSLVKNE